MYCEGVKGECNLGQQEIAFRYTDALGTCDNHSIYKNGAKEIADRHGKSLTFMAKFNEREGNSCHIHISLRGEDGEAVFADTDAQHGMSKLFRALHRRPARAPCASSRCSPRPTSTPTSATSTGSFAPTAIAWGLDNRTCALRVVGHGHGMRVENRVPGGDVNQYLAVAALIAAGLHGIDERARAVGRCSSATPTTSDVARVPATLRESAELFAGSAIAREAFGDEVVEHYLNNARDRARGLRRGRHGLGAGAWLRTTLRRRVGTGRGRRGCPVPVPAASAPMIGVTTYLEQAQTGVWDVPASFLPKVVLRRGDGGRRHRRAPAAAAASTPRSRARRARRPRRAHRHRRRRRRPRPLRAGAASAHRRAAHRPRRVGGRAAHRGDRRSSCRSSASAAARRCSTSRSAAPCTSTCPTSSAASGTSPPPPVRRGRGHGRARHAAGGRSARRRRRLRRRDAARARTTTTRPSTRSPTGSSSPRAPRTA